MIWINDNEIEGMHSNFNGELGLLFEEIREYRTIKYKIRIRDNNIKKKKWYERWVTLEYLREDTKTKIFRELFFDAEPYLFNNEIREELLWTDTRGRENESKTLKEQVKILDTIAKKEIDYVFSLEYKIEGIINEKISNLKALTLEIKNTFKMLKGE